MSVPNVKISVIIPARDAEGVLPRCLDAIKNSSQSPYELMVVDDHSSDPTGEIARRRSVKVLKTEAPSGPGAARNLGAREASGDILCFIDADVVIEPGTLARISSHFQTDSSLTAVFGSYDDAPAEPNFLSQYKNLQHHYVHQTAKREATTFWAGCGAIRRRVFLEVGGFDADKYPTPSIEDIELGYRITANGYRIGLDKNLRVKHLKRWTFRSHIQTEILRRALPWSRLILDSRRPLEDLNLTTTHRLSAGLTWLLITACVLVPFHYLFIVPVVVISLALLVMNRGFYSFLFRHRGCRFVLKAVPFHLLHYWYSAGTFAFCWLLRPYEDLRSRFKRLA
jgi:glycosyltransferase involved in cell wall biosynthesis